jgi:BirA family biotin operon repressor/biotin-[acetyl-CoA-carboxylase] ligase
MWNSDQFELLKAETLVRSVRIFDVLPSTNDEAKRIGGDGEAFLPLLIVARRQTHGRGRAGHRWISDDGALTFSLVVEAAGLGVELDKIPVVSPWTALGVREAIAEAIAETGHGVAATVKWPNDVLLGGKKVAGILVETIATPKPRVIVGIGVNVNNRISATHDHALADHATSLLEVTDQELPVADILRSIACRLDDAWAAMKEHGDQLPERWRNVDHLADRLVRLTNGAEIVSGTNLGVDQDGSMLLDDGTQVHTCRSGSLSSE